MFDKCLECNNSCFFEPVHSLADFNIDIFVFRDSFYVVLVIDFLRDEMKRDTRVSEGLHMIIEIKILDVSCVVSGPFGCI